MIVLIDNYDSFTYNLYQAFEMLKYETKVFRNDKISIDEIRKMSPSHLVISPGPGRPESAGVSLEAIKAFAGEVPILGICLGHQAIGLAFGGTVTHAPQMMHGKSSRIFHDSKTIYQGLKNPIKAGRYHSLIVQEEDLPACLEVSSFTIDGEIMGIRHKNKQVEGVQFHPESIMTEDGLGLLRNFLHQKKCQ